MSRRRGAIVWEAEEPVTYENQDCAAYGEFIFWLMHWETPEEKERVEGPAQQLKSRGFRGYGLYILHMPEALQAYRALCNTHNVVPEAGR